MGESECNLPVHVSVSALWVGLSCMLRKQKRRWWEVNDCVFCIAEGRNPPLPINDDAFDFCREHRNKAYQKAYQKGDKYKAYQKAYYEKNKQKWREAYEKKKNLKEHKFPFNR